MPNFLNSALAQLFDNIERFSGIKLSTFTTNDKPMEQKSINSDQKYMRQYEGEYSPQQYKYLYDPSLSFDLRFHQRLSRISFGDRKAPWVSLIFNTDTNQPLTNVLSHVYKGMEYVPFEYTDKDGNVIQRTEGVEYIFRRVKTPVNFTLISNDLSYLYETTEKVAMYFDRIVNFPYKLTLNFTEDHAPVFDLVGMATDIRQVNLNKLDTASRGSLVMSGFSFNLINYVVIIPDNRYNLLEKVILEIKVAKHNEPISVIITDENT